MMEQASSPSSTPSACIASSALMLIMRIRRALETLLIMTSTSSSLRSCDTEACHRAALLDEEAPLEERALGAYHREATLLLHTATPQPPVEPGNTYYAAPSETRYTLSKQFKPGKLKNSSERFRISSTRHDSAHAHTPSKNAHAIAAAARTTARSLIKERVNSFRSRQQRLSPSTTGRTASEDSIFQQ